MSSACASLSFPTSRRCVQRRDRGAVPASGGVRERPEGRFAVPPWKCRAMLASHNVLRGLVCASLYPFTRAFVLELPARMNVHSASHNEKAGTSTLDDIPYRVKGGVKGGI